MTGRERKAAEATVDEDRLLEGENPRTTAVEDAAHWAAVYRELKAFKERMVGTARESVAHSTVDASREVSKTDLVALMAELRRFNRRLRFWQRRWAELRQRKR
jgi:hypothetical protein